MGIDKPFKSNGLFVFELFYFIYFVWTSSRGNRGRVLPVQKQRTFFFDMLGLLGLQAEPSVFEESYFMF